MSPRDAQTLLKRLAQHKATLKAQHALPKAQRDQKLIDKTKPLIAKINEWLSEKKVKKVPETKKVVTKAEFRDQYKTGFGIREPDSTITIDTIEALDVAWPNIAGKNVLVEAPKAVKDEMRRRIREIRKHQKHDGFR